MNCPNCNKRAVGTFHSFRFGKVGFKKKMQGYAKCRHCDTLLKQKKSAAIIPAYQKTYWIYSVLLIGFLPFLIWYLFEMYETLNLGGWVNGATLVVFMVVMLGLIDELKARYAIIEKVDWDGEVVTPNRKLTANGWIVFLAFTLCSILLFIGGGQYLELDKWGLGVFLVGVLSYIAAVIGGTAFILKKFSKS